MRPFTVALAVLLAPAALLAFAPSPARAAALNIGDPAPVLDVGKWVRGEPVKGLDKGKVHVVEFWATWCGPCRETIPHLTELAKKHPDVTFVGVDVFENDESKVEPFVKEMGEKMAYRVVLDNKAADPKGAMLRTWMTAAGQDGIPTAFVVDREGRVAWIGNPAEMDPVLAAVVGGTHDIKAAAEAAAAAKAAGPRALMGDVLRVKVIGPFRQGKADEAMAAVDELVRANPEFRADLLQVKANLLLERKDFDKAYAVLDEAVAPADTPADRLNDLAWAVLTAPPFEAKRDAGRAVGWAKRADELGKGRDANVLETLALAYAVKGDWDRAVEVQRKAVELAAGDDKAKGERALAAYQDQKLPAGGRAN